MARFQLIQLFAIFAAFFVACANGAATFGAAKAVEPSTDANAENSTSDAGLPSLVLEGAKAVNLTMINEGVKANESIDVQNDNGWSAAIFAVNGNHLDILEGVITLKIDLNIQDKEGYTALHYASSKGDKEMVEILLKNNADPTIKNNNGSTAYDLAHSHGRKLVAYILAEAEVIRGISVDDSELYLKRIKEGAYINMATKSGWTPIIHASSLGLTPIAKELVALGALVNWAENDGWTALHFACANGHKEIVETLLKAGADAHYTNLLGKTPRDFARAAGNKEIVAIIDKFEAETAKEL